MFFVFMMFIILDVFAFMISNYPYPVSKMYTLIPGGGFLALYKFGRRTK